MAFNQNEAAKYLETLKIFAKKGPEILKPTFEESERISKFLSVSKSVNSTGKTGYFKWINETYENNNKSEKD